MTRRHWLVWIIPGVLAPMAVAPVVSAAASGPSEPPTTNVTPGNGDFLGQGIDNVAGVIGSGGHTESAAEVTVSAPAKLPLCGSGEAVGSCQPVTTCDPDPDSPTGYRELTSYGYSPANSDFRLGEPCTPNQAARPSLPDLVLRAFRRVPLPEPQLSIQPPKGKTLVGLETIFSTEAEPFTRQLTLLGRQVTLRIRPSSFLWLHGDGTTQSTDWAGKRWNHDQPDIDGYLTHVYEHTGKVRPSVEVTWSAEFRVGGGAWRPVDGTVTRDGAVVPLQVLEGQPVLNAY